MPEEPKYTIPMKNNTIEQIETLLETPEPQKEDWDKLCALINDIKDHTILSALASPIEEKLAKWPNCLKLMPKEWMHRRNDEEYEILRKLVKYELISEFEELLPMAKAQKLHKLNQDFYTERNIHFDDIYCQLYDVFIDPEACEKNSENLWRVSDIEYLEYELSNFCYSELHKKFCVMTQAENYDTFLVKLLNSEKYNLIELHEINKKESNIVRSHCNFLKILKNGDILATYSYNTDTKCYYEIFYWENFTLKYCIQDSWLHKKPFPFENQNFSNGKALLTVNEECMVVSLNGEKKIKKIDLSSGETIMETVITDVVYGLSLLEEQNEFIVIYDMYFEEHNLDTLKKTNNRSQYIEKNRYSFSELLINKNKDRMIAYKPFEQSIYDRAQLADSNRYYHGSGYFFDYCKNGVLLCEKEGNSTWSIKQCCFAKGPTTYSPEDINQIGFGLVNNKFILGYIHGLKLVTAEFPSGKITYHNLYSDAFSFNESYDKVYFEHVGSIYAVKV